MENEILYKYITNNNIKVSAFLESGYRKQSSVVCVCARMCVSVSTPGDKKGVETCGTGVTFSCELCVLEAKLSFPQEQPVLKSGWLP